MGRGKNWSRGRGIDGRRLRRWERICSLFAGRWRSGWHRIRDSLLVETAAAVDAGVIVLTAYVARITKNRNVMMLQGNFC